MNVQELKENLERLLSNNICSASDGLIDLNKLKTATDDEILYLAKKYGIKHESYAECH